MFCKHGVKWLYRLAKNFPWQSKLDIKQDYAFKDKDGTVRLFGGLVWRIERSSRKTNGTSVQLPY